VTFFEELQRKAQQQHPRMSTENRTERHGLSTSGVILRSAATKGSLSFEAVQRPWRESDRFASLRMTTGVILRSGATKGSLSLEAVQRPWRESDPFASLRMTTRVILRSGATKGSLSLEAVQAIASRLFRTMARRPCGARHCSSKSPATRPAESAPRTSSRALARSRHGVTRRANG